MLSLEFILSSDDDVINKNNNTTSTVVSNSTITLNTGRKVNFSTNPEPTKFVPPPKVQFFYSLQKNSLRTVIDTLLSNSDIGHICTIFSVSGYGRWLKKRQAADLLVEHLLLLKQAQQSDKFNVIVEKINTMKGKEILGRIPKLPEKIDPIPVLKKSFEVQDKILRPTFPVRLNSALKEVTGKIFLDEVGEEFKTSFTLDLYFTIPTSLDNCGSGFKFILCLYQCNQRITMAATNLAITPVSPTLLDLTLNGVSLEQGNFRFRNYDCYDVTLLCYKDRVNLLRILRHETHIDLNHLIIEIVAVNLAGSLSEVRHHNHAAAHGHQSSKRFLEEDEEISFIKEKFLINQNGDNFNLIKYEDSLKLLSIGNVTDDFEIMEDKVKFSLNCPISFTRIIEPVKFKSCKHGQCFDLTNWINLTQNILNLKFSSRSSELARKKFNLKVSCPICGLNLEENKMETFISCGLFKKFLSSAGKEDVGVELNIKTGTFTFIKEEDEDLDQDQTEFNHLYQVQTEFNHLYQVQTEFNHLDQVQTEFNHLDQDQIENIVSNTDEIINVIDSDDDFVNLQYQVDKSKPLGSCPSRAISID